MFSLSSWSIMQTKLSFSHFLSHNLKKCLFKGYSRTTPHYVIFPVNRMWKQLLYEVWIVHRSDYQLPGLSFDNYESPKPTKLVWTGHQTTQLGSYNWTLTILSLDFIHSRCRLFPLWPLDTYPMLLQYFTDAVQVCFKSSTYPSSFLRPSA